MDLSPNDVKFLLWFAGAAIGCFAYLFYDFIKAVKKTNTDVGDMKISVMKTAVELDYLTEKHDKLDERVETVEKKLNAFRAQ